MSPYHPTAQEAGDQRIDGVFRLILFYSLLLFLRLKFCTIIVPKYIIWTTVQQKVVSKGSLLAIRPHLSL